MVPEISWWAVLGATVANMVVGSVWYTPKVFGTYWMRVAKVQPPQDTSAAFRPILVSIALGALTAWVLAGATYLAWSFYGGGYLGNALVTAVVLWAGFTAARFATHDAFEGRPAGLTVLNVAHELVTVLAMALVIGLLPPAGVA